MATPPAARLTATSIRPAALAGAVIVLLGALAALGFAVRSFNNHQGLPYHIGAGSRWGHVAPGEADVVSGTALGAKPRTKLLLDALEFPYQHHKWHVIASTTRLVGPSRRYRFVVHPSVRTHYKVITAIDHLNASRVITVVVNGS
jgi:hypothetical protein